MKYRFPARMLPGTSQRFGEVRLGCRSSGLTDSRIRFKYHCKSTTDLAIVDGDMLTTIEGLGDVLDRNHCS